jgi:glycerophosphoryl diester phosphodiesterase
MATAHARTPRWAVSLPWQASVAAASAIALILAVMLSPGTVEAAGALASLRAPGEAGFIAGHRGGVLAPENTLPAMRSAIAGPAAFLETDLQLTADGVPVLMHDWTVDRTTDGTGPVWAMTFEQLQRLDAGSWFDPGFAGTRVPSFEQFLEVFRPSTKQAILELKGSWNAEQVAGLARSVYEHGVQDRVIFASFDLLSLQNLAAVAPDLARAIISREVIGDPAILAAACGALAIVTSERFITADPGAVERIHAAGLGVLLYTLNDEKTWRSAIELGVDGIITDHPSELGDWLLRAVN